MEPNQGARPSETVERSYHKLLEKWAKEKETKPSVVEKRDELVSTVFEKTPTSAGYASDSAATTKLSAKVTSEYTYPADKEAMLQVKVQAANAHYPVPSLEIRRITS